MSTNVVASTNLRNLKSSELITMYNTAAAKIGARPVNKFSDKETAIARTRAIMAKVGTEVTAEEVRRVSSFPPPAAPEAPAASPTMPSPAPEAPPAPAARKSVAPPPVVAGPGKGRMPKPAKGKKADKAPESGPLDGLPKAGVRMSFSFKPRSDAHPPKGTQITLRSLFYDRMVKGCTFLDVIELIKNFDKGRGKGNDNTIERRAYELVRIMHYTLGFGISHDESTGVIKLYTKS
jgi:hypothetical protein